MNNSGLDYVIFLSGVEMSAISSRGLAPSVGLSEPWRFVVVSDPSKRLAVRRCFESCNKTALAAQSTDDAGLYARLKLAGLEEAPGHIAVFADRATTQGKGLGRHTMPETIEYSSVMAIHTLWLVARAEGMGVGWVSILEPREIQEILATPAHWKFVSYLCVGYPESERDIPVLESEVC
jgi:5,6-dimethylbenzimidazole synthase